MGYTKAGVPFVEGDTSRQAAESMEGSVRSIRLRVLRLIVEAPFGMTCDEVERRLGGRHQTISARIRELVQQGAVRDTGLRRMTSSGRSARIYDTTSFARELF